MHTKIWRSYVHIRYLVHVQKWTYLALGWPYGWALNFNYMRRGLTATATILVGGRAKTLPVLFNGHVSIVTLFMTQVRITEIERFTYLDFTHRPDWPVPL